MCYTLTNLWLVFWYKRYASVAWFESFIEAEGEDEEEDDEEDRGEAWTLPF